jgi:hypothetical protein
MRLCGTLKSTGSTSVREVGNHEKENEGGRAKARPRVQASDLPATAGEAAPNRSNRAEGRNVKWLEEKEQQQ